MALYNNSVGRMAGLLTFAGLVIFLTATTTQAGFEWVPGNAEKPAAAEQTPATDITAPEDMFTPEMPAMESEPLAPQPLSEDEKAALAPVDTNALPVPAPQQQPQPQRLKVITPSQPALAETAQEQEAVARQVPAPVTSEPEFVRGQEPQPLMPPETEALLATTPPAPEAAAPVAGMAPPPSAAPREPKIIMPEDAPDSALKTPNSEKIAIDGNPIIPPAPEAAPKKPADFLAAPYSNFSNAEGFGSDMPLVMALQQVVPADYAFSFGSGVNPGAHVSWSGGKPWNQVVADMTAQLNLRADISGKVVHISSNWKTGAAEKISAQPLQASAQDLTEEPSAPMAPTRTAINDPGAAPAAQPQETLVRMKEIEASGFTSSAPATEAPQSLEPAAGQEAQAAPSAEAAPAAAETAPAEAQPEIQSETQTAPEASPQADASQAAPGWLARSGDSLKDTLNAWSQQAGVEFVWLPAHDYTINVDIATDSSFENAVKTIFANALDGSEKPTPVFLNDAQTEELRALMVKEPAPAQQAASSSQG